MPKTFGISLKISSILHWNISPAGATLKGRYLYWYLPNVVRYDDYTSNHRLWYPELVSIIDMHCTLFGLGNILLSVRPLCIGLINAWLSHPRSRHSLTLQITLGTNTKLLHHSAVSCTPSGLMMSNLCRHSSCSLNGFCSAYTTHLGGTWYDLLSGLSYKENMPLKHSVPLKTSPNLLCTFCIMVLLFLLSAYILDEEKK